MVQKSQKLVNVVCEGHLLIQSNSYSIFSRIEDKELENSLEQTHKFIKILAKMDYVEEKDVKWAFGVLQTNSIGLPTGRALYPIVSIMNHSCAPNMTALTIPGAVYIF